MNTLPIYRLFWISVASTLLCVVLLASCDLVATEPTPTPEPPTPTAEPTPTPLPVGGNLPIRLASDVPNLRPWQPRSRSEEQVITLLYNGLTRLDAQLQPQPDLASEWEIAPNGRVLTFTLRSGITWHDGQPFDANDVRFTLNSLRSLPITSTALLADLQRIRAVSAPTTDTVVISLTERFAPILSHLTLPILPSHLLEGQNLYTFNFWDLPIGTGPFKLENRIPGQAITLTRHAGYHHGAPLLEQVTLMVTPATGVTIEALQTGDLLLAELPWSAANTIAALDSVNLGGYPENGFYFLAFNLRDPRPTSELAVRQALAQAIDVPRLVEAVTDGQGIPIASSAVPGSWADVSAPPRGTSNLEGARELLNEAGWLLPPGMTIRQREGKSLTLRLFVRSDDPRRIAAAERIASIATSIGIEISIERANFSSVILSKYAPPYDFDLLLGGWIGGVGDADFADFVYYDPDDFALFHSSQISAGPADTRITRNFVAFRDETYDNQAQAGRQLYSLEERIAAYQQTQARIASQVPYLYLWTDRIPVALNRRVTTLDGPVNLSTPAYLWNIERWYLQPN